MTAAEIPGGHADAALGRLVRAMFVRMFLGHFDLALVRAALPAVGAWKCADRNMLPAEVAAMERLIATESRWR